MKVVWAVIALSVAAAAPAAQDGTPRLERVDPSRAPAPPRGLQEDEFDAATWKAALVDPNLERREGAFDNLIEKARRSPLAKQQILLWAGEQGELAWTSRLALRELESTDNTFDRGGARRNRRPMQRLRISPVDDFGLGDPFQELESRLDDLFRGMQPGGVWQQAPGGSSQSRSFQMETGPSGVKIEVREDKDGVEDAKVYEAETLEELLEAHPELREHMEPVEVFPDGARRNLDDTIKRLRGRFQPWVVEVQKPAPIPTDILGVVMHPAAAAETQGRGVSQGLLVERIVPNTIAEVIGIRRGDILTELNGRALESGDDVSAALTERKPADEVKVRLVDSRGHERTLSWTPSLDGN